MSTHDKEPAPASLREAVEAAIVAALNEHSGCYFTAAPAATQAALAAMPRLSADARKTILYALEVCRLQCDSIRHLTPGVSADIDAIANARAELERLP